MGVVKERLEEVKNIVLDKGSHEPNKGMCVMEAVAYVAGEEWSDRPRCASPVIGAFMRSWNDSLDTEGRQRLKPYIPRLVGTAASQEVEEARSFMAGDWQVRVFTPAWLELAGVTEAAAVLRSLPPLMDPGAVNAAIPAIQGAKKEGAAAWTAAGTAAGDAAWAAAWTAAWTAAGAAAWAAARAAARGAAGDAARDAAKQKLEPTKVELQASAFDLLDRMIEVSDA